ncbi:hypothetical protein EON63_13490 [archaeon]|nr:MAG: hypothetical protein EON63_13490 [archaeon]
MDVYACVYVYVYEYVLVRVSCCYQHFLNLLSVYDSLIVVIPHTLCHVINVNAKGGFDNVYVDKELHVFMDIRG